MANNEYTPQEQWMLEDEKALPLHEGLQRIVDSVNGIVGYETEDADVIELYGEKHYVSARVRFKAQNGRAVSIPFLGNLPRILPLEHIDGTSMVVRNWLTGNAS